MEQPVPKVTEEDVHRIAVRDFGEASLPEVLSALDEFGKQEWNEPDNPRVRLAILKLAQGDQLAKCLDFGNCNGWPSVIAS
jgi:hypothetical protein